MTPRINAHGHLLPDPAQIPAFMREQRIFWIDEQRRFMHQDDWKRPITDPSFFLAEKLDWMARNDIHHEVVLNLSQLYCNGYSRQKTADVLRFQNDFNAALQHDHPRAFTTGFTAQAAWMDDALREVERCVLELGMSLLCLPTHFLNTQGQWLSIAHESAEPLFALADQHGLAVEIHPYDAPRMIALPDQHWRFHLVWMCAQTADVYHEFTLRGLHDKYPRVRTCFAHGNQFGQVNIGRRTQGYEGRPDLFAGMQHPAQALGASNVFFDTLVHDVLSFNLLLQRQGISQIVAGMDDPYPLGEMDTVPGCYPGKVIDEAVAHGFITPAEREQVWYDNVLRWLCGEHQSELRDRLGNL